MFEAAEIGSKVSKEDFEARVPDLRVELINAQYDLRNADFPFLIVVAGDDRVAINDAANLLNEWMDARFIRTQVFPAPSDEERERPRFWRYWRSMPSAGQTGLFLAAWPMNTIVARVWGGIKKAELNRRIHHEIRFENELVGNGALIVKFWLHLSGKEHAKRLKQAEKKPGKAWRVQDIDRDIYSRYDKFHTLAERYIRETDSTGAPWHIIESNDVRHRRLAMGETVLKTLRERLAQPGVRSVGVGNDSNASVGNLLDTVDLASSLPYYVYKKKLGDLQQSLSKLSLETRERGVATVLAFEGWDAAGKGGVIRRITHAMSARDYRIIPVMAPTDEERSHHYLWRFWRHLPRAGRMLIFDRTWYGRVLVERVEGLATEEEWRRAYTEINDFEAQLVEHGMVVQKFWLHIDADEQLRRFQAREATPYKKYKITAEDYRNREQRDAYTAAVNEMVARTSTGASRWNLVPANDKRWARIQVLEAICDGLEKALDCHR